MNKIPTVLLGLLILFSSSCRLLKPSKDMGYDFVATLFNGEIGADGMHYFIKNLDGTIYNSNVALVDGGPSVDSALGEKIFVFYWANEAYGFFCKKPQKGKPLQILVGDEWKLLNHTESVRVDSTVKFFQRYMYSPKIEKGQESRLINVYLTPREDLSQQFEIRQDSTEIKHFFVREIRGEWMKLQLCIDYSSYFAVCVGALTTEAWEEISKHSESYPIYWIRWRQGTKLLTPLSDFYDKYAYY